MKNKLNYLNITISKTIWFVFLCILVHSSVYTQTTSNIEKFYTLVDSASNLFINDIGDVKKINLELNLGTEYSLFANKVRGKLIKRGVEIVPKNSSDGNSETASFVIDNCNVNYTEPYRDGWFGDFYTNRQVSLSGNYYISSNQIVQKFNLTEVDTINIEDVERIEDRSYPFTQGELPPEPFFASLLEPVVAITAAATIIVLFFSVRSK